MIKPPSICLRRSPGASTGFTLIELLIVFAIIAIMAYLVLPVSTSLQEASKLTMAGQIVTDELAIAREYAASHNQAVCVRFIVPTNSTSHGFTAMQLWKSDPSRAGSFVAVDRAALLPAGIEISSSSTLSPLVSSLVVGSSSAMPNGANVPGNYVSFIVRPDGTVTVNAPPTLGSSTPNAAFQEAGYYFLTLQSVRYDNTGTLPPNYLVIQVNPDTANTQVFQP